MIDFGFDQDEMELGGHVALIYDNDEDRLELIMKYLEAGIAHREKLFYLVDVMSIEEFRHELEKVQILCPEAQFALVYAEEGYCPDGKFSKDEMLKTLSRNADEAIQANFIGLRASGEMSWALKMLDDNEELMQYESQLNEITQTLPVLALCQYDTRKFNGETIMDVLKTHPYVAIKGKIIKNPYYLTPKEFLRTYKVHPLH